MKITFLAKNSLNLAYANPYDTKKNQRVTSLFYFVTNKYCLFYNTINIIKSYISQD